MAAFARFQAHFFHGVGLEETIELLDISPMAGEVVVLDLATGEIADNRIAPVGKLDGDAANLVAKQLKRAAHR